MKKSTLAIICGAAGILVGALALLIVFTLMNVTSPAKNVPTQEITEITANTGERELIDAALDIAGMIKRGDYASIAALVHPEYGVYFAPTATVSLSSNKCFTAAEVAKFADSKTNYVWGLEEDSGSPIEMTPNAYFIKYVFDSDYTAVSLVGVNRVVKSGNALDNVTEVFPESKFVDLYNAGTKDKDYTDWSILRLVFEQYEGRYMLTAVIHSEESI